ncbi:hypothetical protein DFH06DRAFT_1126571 [Mycena polygramma]|nr:hypothetical protein DFH06DRAFT_1126571 [Mycena polygramma]
MSGHAGLMISAWSRAQPPNPSKNKNSADFDGRDGSGSPEVAVRKLPHHNALRPRGVADVTYLLERLVKSDELKESAREKLAEKRRKDKEAKAAEKRAAEMAKERNVNDEDDYEEPGPSTRKRQRVVREGKENPSKRTRSQQEGSKDKAAPKDKTAVTNGRPKPRAITKRR